MIPAYDGPTLVPVDKLEVHRRGLRHPAVSVFLFQGGHTLLQQRAADKYHSPLQWANACCTHPHWGEDIAVCAHRRLGEELGLDLPLRIAGHLSYRADVGNGLTEHEDITLFTAHLETAPVITPNPREVAATRWITLDDLARAIKHAPEEFTPWLRIYMAQHRALIRAQKDEA